MRQAKNIKTTKKQIVDYWAEHVSEAGLSIDFSEADKRCWRCGCQRTLERCHIVPDSLGGEDTPSNFVLLFRGARAAVRFAGPDAGGETLGALLGLPGYPPSGAPQQAPAEKALVFYAFSDPALDRLLGDLRGRGLALDALKAVVTAHNRGWTLAALLAELRCERESFAKGQGGQGDGAE